MSVRRAAVVAVLATVVVAGTQPVTLVTLVSWLARASKGEGTVKGRQEWSGRRRGLGDLSDHLACTCGDIPQLPARISVVRVRGFNLDL